VYLLALPFFCVPLEKAPQAPLLSLHAKKPSSAIIEIDSCLGIESGKASPFLHPPTPENGEKRKKRQRKKLSFLRFYSFSALDTLTAIYSFFFLIQRKSFAMARFLLDTLVYKIFFESRKKAFREYGESGHSQNVPA